MSIVVNTNIASMNAQRSLMHSGKELQSAMERLSTGKKKLTVQRMTLPASPLLKT
jgi:flagellin-like hook-associated protein FlgL